MPSKIPFTKYPRKKVAAAYAIAGKKQRAKIMVYAHSSLEI